MFCTRTTNCCVRRPPAPFVVRESAAPPPSLVEREAVKWDLNHDVAVVVRPTRGALSFLAFTFLSLAGAAVHFTHPSLLVLSSLGRVTRASVFLRKRGCSLNWPE